MSKKGKQIHAVWCDYMVEKATNNILIYRKEEVKKSGVKSNNMTRNELIFALSK